MAIRATNYTIATDGGTQVLELELDNGERLLLGLDGRMGSPMAGKQLFIGASPDGENSRLLALGSPEEREAIALLERWLDETQGMLRRESLLDADPKTLEKQNLLDRMGIEFWLDIRNRDLG